MLKKCVFIFIFCFCFTLGAQALSTSATSAILVEQSTLTALYEQNADQRMPMASTTKIMTALLTIENCDVDDTITVSAAAAGTEGSSMYLKAGEQIKVCDLLYGLMLSSGNDAANALAEYVGKSKDGFVKMMNDKAAQIGLCNTSFATPSGLDGKGHYSTARDMAVLTAYAMNNELFRKIVSTKSKSVGTGDTTHFLVNHNRLLSSYKYACGVKTGYTITAGRCLVSAAQKDGVTLIVVTLNDRNDWKDHIKLFDYGFENTYCINFADSTKKFCEVNAVGYEGNNIVEVYPKLDLKKVYFDDSGKDIIQRVYLPRFLYAPINKGDKVGEICFYKDNQLITSVELVAANDIKQLKDKEINGFINWLGKTFVAILGLK